MNKILVIIPARGDSKEVPNKNIKKIHGIPLIVYTIKEVLKLIIILLSAVFITLLILIHLINFYQVEKNPTNFIITVQANI